MTDEQTVAARDVLAERKRQIEAEGWTAWLDDAHVAGELACAAAAYSIRSADVDREDIPSIWPWGLKWWRPTSRRRYLVKAGALILAEIERLDRLAKLPI